MAATWNYDQRKEIPDDQIALSSKTDRFMLMTGELAKRLEGLGINKGSLT